MGSASQGPERLKEPRLVVKPPKLDRQKSQFSSHAIKPVRGKCGHLTHLRHKETRLCYECYLSERRS